MFGALPWIAVALTAVAFVAFPIAHRRNAHADAALLVALTRNKNTPD